MNISELKSKIKGVFKPPVPNYYIGKLRYGTPYFYPWNFNKNVITVLKLIKTSQEDLDKLPNAFLKKAKVFKNLPMVRRSKDWIVKLFGNHYYISVGWPVSIGHICLGWKDKFETPRFEWPPAFYIFFFNWQFFVHWTSPDGEDDSYYEQVLWYTEYSKSDLEVAKKTWPWTDSDGNSTWNNNYEIQINKTI